MRASYRSLWLGRGAELPGKIQTYYKNKSSCSVFSSVEEEITTTRSREFALLKASRAIRYTHIIFVLMIQVPTQLCMIWKGCRRSACKSAGEECDLFISGLVNSVFSIISIFFAQNPPESTEAKEQKITFP